MYHHTDGLGSTIALTDTVGLVTDRYTYDAYGGTVDHQGTFGNSFQFAGEQRDSSTGLDYLRARYYDSSLGRFVSADPFSGFMNDPMSLHNYQYANSNPTRYTDPSGYFPNMAEIGAALTIASQLALMGSVTFGTGYIIGGAIAGADISEMIGNFGTGFANGMSGGMITDVYELGTGKKVVPRHGALHNAGMVAGVAASILTGAKFVTWAMTAAGPLKVIGTVGAGFDALSQGYSYGLTTRNVYGAAQDGWQWEDNINLLGYIPLAMNGASRFIAGAKAAKNPKAANVDASAQHLGETNIKAGTGCFVAGTEILTTEGIKNIEDIRAGDWVIADDPTTLGEIEKRQVITAYEREATKLIDIYVDGEVISATEEHPFWVVDKGWVEPKDLQVGDKLQTEDGRVVDVDKVENREGDFKVYNFSVEGIPTYFVSELKILVHNNNWGCYLRKLKGDPPEGMPDPHAHHILYKKGRGSAQQELVQEGQQILREAGIDPIMGPENLGL